MSNYKTVSRPLLSKLCLTLLVLLFIFAGSDNANAQNPSPLQALDYTLVIEGDQEINLRSEGIATGDPDGPHSTYPWPYTFEQMGHTNASYQYYGGGLHNAYFHHGIDMIAPNGTQVFTRSGGQVVNVENYRPGNHLYWEVAILDPEGYVWQYHHIDVNTIPQAIHDAYSAYQADPTTGGFVDADTHIGDIVDWPVESFGYFFHHIHLNILADGDIFINPLEFHEPGDLPDTQDPVIEAIGLLNGDTIIAGDTVSASTAYSLYLKAYDLYQSEVYDLPPHKIEYMLDNSGEWITTWEFRKLPGGNDSNAFVNDLYIPNLTQGNYEKREFYFDLGFSPYGTREFPKTFGFHTIDVRISDFAGNASQQSYTWLVTESIQDNGCLSRQGITRTFNFSSNKPVGGLELKLLIAHEKRGDLWITLKAPGEVVPTYVINNNLDQNKNFNVTINDQHTEPLHNGLDDVLVEPYFARLVGPSRDGNLDPFIGKPARGDWTVFICDRSPGNTGELMMLDLVLSFPDNIPPVAENQSLRAAYQVPLAIKLKGSDADGDPLTYQVLNQPTHGALSGTAANLTYTPKTGFVGADSFTFVVNDGVVASEPATISIQVLAPIFIPVVVTAE